MLAKPLERGIAVRLGAEKAADDCTLTIVAEPSVDAGQRPNRRLSAVGGHDQSRLTPPAIGERQHRMACITAWPVPS